MELDRKSGARTYKNYYHVLGVVRSSTFSEIKKAYFQRAKDCHPDLHPGNPRAVDEFLRLVTAFDVLSDPDKRHFYDAHLEAHGGTTSTGRFVFKQIGGHPIMDSFADDILEEIIVGNTIPENTTLQKLLLDLEHSERFIRFREGKTHYKKGRYEKALSVLSAACKYSPDNILYHYYQALTAEKLRKWSLAEKQLKICVWIGDHRSPPQQLIYIRQRLHTLRQTRRGVFGRIKCWLAGEPPQVHRDSDQAMIDATSRNISQLLGKQKRKVSGSKTPKQLPPGEK